nr:putative ribonuclease H-like domain-containing protein [Tanacetum cinerariifolium]
MAISAVMLNDDIKDLHLSKLLVEAKSEGLDDDEVDSKVIEEDKEETLVRTRPSRVVIGGKAPIDYEEKELITLRRSGITLEVPDELILKSSDEGAGIIPEVSDEPRKATAYDRLRIPMLQLLWGMVTSNNIDFAEIIWEEFKYQIESRKISKRPLSFQHVIKLNTTLRNLKFVNKGSKDLIFGMAISAVMLNDDIKDLHLSKLLAEAKSDHSKPHDESSTKIPEGIGNSNPTASSFNPPADHMETLTVESPIPTVSSPVLTACLNDSPEPFIKVRLISKRVANQEESPSLDNILSLTNRFEDILGVTTSSNEEIGVEADVSNMETSITASLSPTLRIHKDHPKSQIIGPVDTPIQTRHKFKVVEEQKPKKVSDALQDPSKVKPIGTKWVLKNKKDERGIVVRNKARLVAQGHTKEEGFDYDEVFAPVARIEAIRLFLAYALFMGFTVYQMDVKSAFLYGTIDEKVYVMQPPRFQDPAFPAKVYKVEKAMYGLHQAPRAWYGTLSKYLLKNGFQMGTIDQTLFIRRQKEDFILVQVYVDDIIFGLSNPQLCREFEALMHEKF